MSRYKRWRKHAGKWVAQNTAGFFTKIAEEWRLVEKVYEKQEGAWVVVSDVTFPATFESSLADGETLTITQAGTLRVTATGYWGLSGRGGRGGLCGDTTLCFNWIPLVRDGGNGGGGGGGGKGTGATAISDVDVAPGDTLNRDDSATHVRIYHNSVLLVSAEHGREGTEGFSPSKRNVLAAGGAGGGGGQGGRKGRASESVGNVSTADGTDGHDGKTGGRGQNGPCKSGRGSHGSGGQGFPNSGRAGDDAGHVGSGGTGGRSYPHPRILHLGSEVKIEVVS